MKKEAKKEIKKETRNNIEDIVPVENKKGEITHIDIVLDNGMSFSVPNSKSALEHFRNIMLEQTKEQKGLFKGKRIAINACNVIAVAGLAGVVLFNGTHFSREVGQLTPSVLSGAVTLGSCIGTIVNGRKLCRLQSNVTFAHHKDQINAAIRENPYLYLNVSRKDRKLIEMWLEMYDGEPLMIENISKLDVDTIQKIWTNMNLQKQFGFEYNADGVIEEPGFQKIIENHKK